MDTKVYTNVQGDAVIEQPSNSIVLSSEQILAVIQELHLCYDYCAAWKEVETLDSSSGHPGSDSLITR